MLSFGLLSLLERGETGGREDGGREGGREGGDEREGGEGGERRPFLYGIVQPLQLHLSSDNLFVPTKPKSE